VSSESARHNIQILLALKTVKVVATETSNMSTTRGESRALHWGLSRVDALMMAVVVIAISSSGPIIALSTAPVLAMATWRCILGSAATFPLAYRKQGLATLNRAQLRGCIFAGLALGIHFALWIPSVRLTSVANSVALVATQPIWMLLMNKRLGHQIPRRVWVGIVIAIIGVLTVVGVDFGVSTRALLGDAMAVAGAAAAGAYLMIGGHVRTTVSNSVYTVIVYAVSAVTLGLLSIGMHTPLWGFSQKDWLLIAALTLGAQLLGHSLMSRLMESTSATVVGIAVLFEPPGAAIFAGLLLHQHIPATAVLGMCIILCGLVMVVRQA